MKTVKEMTDIELVEVFDLLENMYISDKETLLLREVREEMVLRFAKENR